VETAQAKIYHHHVPRKYLLPWADEAERVAWYGYDRVMRSKLTVVGGENDFYKLKELTVRDIDCMGVYINSLPEISRDGHRRFLQMYMLPTQLKRRLEACGDTSPEAMKLLNVLISNFNEDYHAAIENRFWPYLDAIKKRDFSFYDDPNSVCEFFHGLYVQYLRTKAVKDRACQKESPLFDDMARVWDVLSHISAVQAGGSFFVSRNSYKIVVLDNDTQVPFITSDQPIINMLTPGGSYDVPDRMDLYYPLSPTQAMLFLESSTPIGGISQNVSIDEAHRYNMMIFDHKGSSVFSNSEDYLRHLQQSAPRKG
jgi:Protein of unknown function (DUF4238)